MRSSHLSLGVCAVLLVLTASARSDSTAVTDTLKSGFTVTVEQVLCDNAKLLDTLDVVLESSDVGEVAAFVFKIGTDSRFVDIIEVLPGEIPDSCEWDFFRATQMSVASGLDAPSSLWKVMGLSKMTPDTTRAGCLGFDRPATLARLVVSSAHLIRVPDTTAAVFFYWEDCRDNTLSDSSGALLCVSRSVTDRYSVDLPENVDRFPNRVGTPSECIDPRRKNPPVRRVDFLNGGVEFKFDIGEPEPDSTVDSLLQLH